jgi:hypothetical protein
MTLAMTLAMTLGDPKALPQKALSMQGVSGDHQKIF